MASMYFPESFWRISSQSICKNSKMRMPSGSKTDKDRGVISQFAVGEAEQNHRVMKVKGVAKGWL